LETGRLTELVVKAQRGDADALQELYLDAFRSVFHFALRMVKNPEDAEDITQEVFITVHEKISGLREPAAFYKWLNQITANKCNDLLRKYKGIASLDDDEEILALIDDDPNNMPDKAIDDEDTRRIILGTIDALPDGQRACVLLYYYQQCTIAQIADALELNENTVKTRLSLARAKIRAALEEKEKKEGIKLWGVPLALTPILKQAEQDFVMPEGAAERIWENISKITTKIRSMERGNKGGLKGTASNPVKSTSVQTTAKASLSLATKIIMGAIAAMVVTGAILTVPMLINNTDNPSEEGTTSTTPALSGTEQYETTPPVEDGESEASQSESGERTEPSGGYMPMELPEHDAENTSNVIIGNGETDDDAQIEQGAQVEFAEGALTLIDICGLYADGDFTYENAIGIISIEMHFAGHYDEFGEDQLSEIEWYHNGSSMEAPSFEFGETSYDERDGGFTRYVYFLNEPLAEKGSYYMTFLYQGDRYSSSVVTWHDDGTLSWSAPRG